jgi:hypothetical protein
MEEGELATTTGITVSFTVAPTEPQKQVVVVVAVVQVVLVLYSLNTQHQQLLRIRLLLMRTLRRLVRCRLLVRIQQVVLRTPWRRTLECWRLLVIALLVGTLWLMGLEQLMWLVVER